MKRLINRNIFYLLISTLLFSCRPDDPLKWPMNILGPIVSGSLTIEDLAGDSLVSANPDNSLKLVYQYNLYHSEGADILQVPDTTTSNSFSLKTLVLNDQTITNTITLGQIYPPIAIFHGSYVDVPAQSIDNAPPQDLNASSFFDEATFISGSMEFKLTNQLPVNISRVIFALRNKSDKKLVLQDTFFNIAPGDSQLRSKPLDGKSVEAIMEVVVINLQTDASPGPVLIDKDKGLIVEVSVRDLRPFSATAVFPAQNVVDQQEEVVYDFGGPQVKFGRIKSGKIKILVISTIEEAINVTYSVPNAKLGGVPLFRNNIKVPPAPKGSISKLDDELSLAGYEIDYRGKNFSDTVHSTFFQILTARIDSTGIKRSISLNDSIYLFYGLVDIVMEYATGYLGSEEIAIKDHVDLSVFKNLSGNLDPEDVRVSLAVRNGIGADASIKFNDITGVNTISGASQKLNSPLLATPFIIPRATDNPFKPATTSLNLTKSNSNIKPLIQILPDRLNFDLVLKTNPNGNISQWKDFMYLNSDFNADLEIEMPLSFKSSGLQLTDTLDFSFQNIQNGSRISSGTFKLLADNGFPFSAKVQMFMLDENGRILDSLLVPESNTALAGKLNLATMKVDQPVRSVLVSEINKARMQHLKNARKVIIKAVFTTPPSGANYPKVFKEYKLDFKLTGDFEYDAQL